jgi:hypothetical protein
VITSREAEYIYGHGYVPEHVTNYVKAVTEGEPFLLNDYLYYSAGNQLFFVGYPIREQFDDKIMNKVLDTIVDRIKPELVNIIAPMISTSQEFYDRRVSDSYYKLDLSTFHISQKLWHMVKRAARELFIERKREITGEHARMTASFLSSRTIDDSTRHVFESIPEYVASVPTALVLSARDREKRLIAFDIVDSGTKGYCFYMFNIRSTRWYVPGASDLLLYEVIKVAREQEKSMINLGLGINDGVRFFKKKWGGTPFLNYEFRTYHTDSGSGLKSLLQKL